MVDDPSGQPTIPPAPDSKPPSSFATFLSSSTGKLIIGSVLLFIVLVALGAVAFFFLFNAGTDVVIPPAPAGGSETTTEAAAPTDPPKQTLDETFTFRNIFAPTVSPPPTPEETTSDSSSSDDTSDTSGVPEDTLVLKSIHSESGERVATFIWNGNTYECKEGDQVDDSPWEVVTINSDSVVMLYGDSRVTLTVGQGFGDSGAYDK